MDDLGKVEAFSWLLSYREATGSEIITGSGRLYQLIGEQLGQLSYIEKRRLQIMKRPNTDFEMVLP